MATVETICSGALIALFLYLYKKSPLFAFFLLLTEIALGGTGHFISFFGISLRTCLTLLFLSFFYFFERKKITSIHLPQGEWIATIVFFSSIILSIVLGYFHGHRAQYIIQDTIPFLSFGLILPFVIYWKEIITARYTHTLASVFIFGNTIFSAITLGLFSFGITYLHDPYYKWYRDIASGKITDMGTGFFRIVLPEHALLIPIVLIITSLLIKKPQQTYLRILQICSLFVLTINFSRIYFLSLCIGLLFLVSKDTIKKWFKEVVIFLCLILTLFSFTHSTVSRDHSFGFELFGDRASSIINPGSEISSATRLTLLPEIIKKITASPVFGSGLGDTVRFTNPESGAIQETRQFDWGYFELWAEMGFVGLASLLFLILFPIYTVWRNPNLLSPEYMTQGSIAGCIGLLVVTLTTPVLFHVFGTVYIAFFLASLLQTSRT